MSTILVVNAGSSSVKFQVFGLGKDSRLERHIKGQVDGIGRMPRLRATGADGASLIDRTYEPNAVADVPAALALAGAWLRDDMKIEPDAVGHRVVHGGPRFAKPVRVTPQIVRELEEFVPLAPLHQPHNLAPINALLESRPDLPQVACFDTAFHRSHDWLADTYALTETLYDEGVRRYGFHGLSYEYIASALPHVAQHVANGRIVVAHLGSGASMCAIRDGKSVESTMGFTALDGLPMGTRPGQLDPGVVLYLLEQKGMSPGAVQDFLYRECGLKGLSGISNDMRELEASADPRAAKAVDYFVHRIALATGMLAAALQGLDAFVFTAGIGENSPSLRARVCARLAWLGIALDDAANRNGDTLISAPSSRIPVYVLQTDEEAMIARHTRDLLAGIQTETLCETVS